MNRLIQGGELVLYGPVGIADFFDGFTAADVVGALAEMKGDITIRLNSGGGIATEGSAIFNALERHKGRKTILIDGIAASAASVIAMAGDVIEMPPGTFMMIHEPSGLTAGPASDHRQVAGVLDTMTGVYAELYAARTGLTEKEIRRMMAEETWMTPSEALQLGFATSAPTKATAASADATFNYTTYLKAPASLKAMAQHRSEQGAPLVAMISNAQGTPKMTDIIEDNDQDEITLEAKPARRRDQSKRIMEVCAAARMSASETLRVIEESGGDLVKAQSMVIGRLADDPVLGGPASITGHVITDPRENQVKFIADAIYARLAGKAAEGPARDWSGASMIDMGRAFLEANGQRAPRNPEMVVSMLMAGNSERGRSWFMSGGQHSTSDFPSLLGSSAEKFMADAYMANQSPLKAIARERNASNFRPLTQVRLGEMPRLLEVPEGAEVTSGTRGESVATFSVKTYARIFSLTRQAIINDDLSAFAQVLADFGAAAAQTEAQLLVDLLEANPVISEDNTALFHTDHANTTTGTLTAARLDAARLLLRKTVGIDGATILNLAPRYLVVPADIEGRGESVLSDIQATTVDDVNNWSGKVELVVEPRLASSTQWYLFADPRAANVIEHAYLNGVKQPTLMTQDGWNVEGTEFKARLDYGCGATGFRGAVRSTGG